MTFIHGPKFPIFLFLKGRLLLDLHHRLHHGHAESGALIPEALDIDSELVLDSLQLNLQLANHVFQLADLNLGVSSLPDAVGHLILVVVP